MNILDRIYKIIEYEGVSTNEFSKKINVSNGYFAKQRANNANVGSHIIEKIVISFPIIDPEWLLTGKGEMLRATAPELPIAIPDMSKKAIPFVLQNVIAGFGNADFSISERDVKEYYIIPRFKYLHIDFMIEVYGSSMRPKYNSGDIIACTILHEQTFLQWNKCHVIATREQGILVKRLRQSDNPESLTAISDNKEYPPFDIPLSEITGIALVVGVIRLE